MKHSEYSELLRLADALTFVSESELLCSLIKDAGYVLSSFDIEILIKLVANAIYSNLTE